MVNLKIKGKMLVRQSEKVKQMIKQYRSAGLISKKQADNYLEMIEKDSKAVKDETEKGKKDK